MARSGPSRGQARQRRRPKWVLISALVIAAVAVGGVLWWANYSSTEGADSSASAVVPEPVPVERLIELQVALSSPHPAVQAGALDPAIFASLQAGGQPLLPAGSNVTIDTDSSQITGQTASVSAAVSGPRPGEFTLLLALEAGVWVVYAAVPV